MMERIEILTPQEKAKNIQFIAETIENARHLNKIAEKNVSNPLPGVEMLYGILQARLIDTRLYHEMKRVIEDPTLEYEITI